MCACLCSAVLTSVVQCGAVCVCVCVCACVVAERVAGRIVRAERSPHVSPMTSACMCMRVRRVLVVGRCVPSMRRATRRWGRPWKSSVSYPSRCPSSGGRCARTQTRSLPSVACSAVVSVCVIRLRGADPRTSCSTKPKTLQCDSAFRTPTSSPPDMCPTHNQTQHNTIGFNEHTPQAFWTHAIK